MLTSTVPRTINGELVILDQFLNKTCSMHAYLKQNLIWQVLHFMSPKFSHWDWDLPKTQHSRNNSAIFLRPIWSENHRSPHISFWPVAVALGRFRFNWAGRQAIKAPPPPVPVPRQSRRGSMERSSGVVVYEAELAHLTAPVSPSGRDHTCRHSGVSSGRPIHILLADMPERTLMFWERPRKAATPGRKYEWGRGGRISKPKTLENIRTLTLENIRDH